MKQTLQWSAAMGLMLWLMPVACSSAGDERYMTQGSAIDGSHSSGSTDNPGSGDGTGSSTDTGTGTAVLGGDDGVDEQPSGKTERTLEECSGLKKAWIAVVDGGNQPAECGESLVSWCCSTEQAKKVFPTMAAELDKRFQQNINVDGYKLYHCSASSDTKTTFHFAKIEAGGARKYRTVFISDIYPAAVDNGMASCAPQLTTPDLIVNNDAASLNFDTDIKPVLASHCGGSACHADSSTLPDKDKFLNSESKFKASNKERIRDDTMPPSGSPALDVNDKAKLLYFLGG